jgi:DNA-binding CsgD family transcriptional regulator
MARDIDPMKAASRLHEPKNTGEGRSRDTTSVTGKVTDAGKFLASPFLNCLVDHTGRQFVCMSEACRDSTNCFKNRSSESDFQYHLLEFHPDDERLFCLELFPELMRFMESVQVEELPEFRYSFNHRFIKIDGTASEFILEGVFMKPFPTAKPVLVLTVFAELGEIRDDNSIILTIYRYDQFKGYLKVLSKEYCTKPDSVLSKRELEIIRLCREGYTSKSIADQLNISMFTVKNHKRNCMQKTSVRNIAELVHLCTKRNWL